MPYVNLDADTLEQRPIVAPGWLVVHCLWVSGRYQKQGHAKALVDYALDDARQRGAKGLVIAAAKTKRPFMADPRFLRKQGFQVVDEAGQWRLFARSVEEGVPVSGSSPVRFSEGVHQGQQVQGGEGFTARYTDQCPFNAHWSQQVADSLRRRGHTARVERVDSRAGVLDMASPLGAYSLERGGALACHHLTTDGATQRMLDKL